MVLCQCHAQLWVHDHCVEASGPCPKCGRTWDDERGAEEHQHRLGDQR
jgi:hypothetical protein